MRSVLCLLICLAPATASRLRGVRVSHSIVDTEQTSSARNLAIRKRGESSTRPGIAEEIALVQANLARKGGMGNTAAATSVGVGTAMGMGMRGNSDDSGGMGNTAAATTVDVGTAMGMMGGNSGDFDEVPILPTVRVDGSMGSMGSMGSDTLRFFHDSPSTVVAVSSTDPELDDIGTVYIYRGALMDGSATQIPDAQYSGTCTKTQMAASVGGVQTQWGAGFCHFTYVFAHSDDGTPLVTMNVAGDVEDFTGGFLSITGGTDYLVGATGEARVTPMFTNPTTETDFFLEAAAYEINATIV